MKGYLLFLFFLIFSATALVAISLYVIPLQKHQTVTPGNINTKFSLEHAPSDSLFGYIDKLSGDVYWQSRIATEPAALRQVRAIQQGENIVTKKNGYATISFPQNVSIQIGQNAELDIIQTLPSHLVFSQKNGGISYTQLGSSIISVNTSDLLITLNSGAMKISVDTETEKVAVQVIQGTITVAYEDFQNLSNVYTVHEGHTFIFDDPTRTSRVVVD